MTGLSLAMIVKDEQATLGRALSDIESICDEIVVVDTGSSDDSVSIAKSCGAEVYVFDWEDDFSKARNYSFSKCHGDWIFWVDADDRILPSCRDAIRAIYEEMRTVSRFDAVSLPYYYEYPPESPDHCRISTNRERLIRNGIGLEWRSPIHESIKIPLERLLPRSNAWVEHRPLPEQLERKSNRNRVILEKAVATGDRNAWTLAYLADSLMVDGDQEGALALYEEAAQLPSHPDNLYDLLLGYAQCAKNLGNSDQQVHLLTEAMLLNPRRSEAFVQLGLHCFERDEFRNAMPYFSAASVLERPADCYGMLFEPGYSWFPWDYLSVCASKLGRYKAAVTYGIRAFRGNPEPERLWDNLRADLLRLDPSDAPRSFDLGFRMPGTQVAP